MATPELEGIQVCFAETPALRGVEAFFVETPVFRGMEVAFAETPAFAGMEADLVETLAVLEVFPPFVCAGPAHGARTLIFQGSLLDSGNLVLKLKLAGHPTLTIGSPTALDRHTAVGTLDAQEADPGRYDVEATTDAGVAILPQGFAIKPKPLIVGGGRGRR